MQTKDSNWRDFIKFCRETASDNMLAELLELLLSIEERKDIAQRYAIVRELIRGDKTQRKIAEKLNVSIVKITRGSNALKIISPNLGAFLKKIIR